MTAMSTDEIVCRYMELARKYHRFEARYFGMSWLDGELQPAERPDEETLQALTDMRIELDAAREAWIESMLRP